MSTHGDDLHPHPSHLSDTEGPAIPGLGTLAREASPARDLWPEIEARIAGRAAVPLRSEAPPRRRNLLRAAAAVMLFAGGLAVGHQWGRSSALSSAVPEMEAATRAEMASRIQLVRRVVPAAGNQRASNEPTTVMPAAVTGALDIRRVPAGSCPEGYPTTGDLGIETLLCVEGSCSVNLQPGRGSIPDFSAEPRIGGLTPGGPAAGTLRNGDILLSIDGVPVTTREGGRRLANLTPGRPVTLRIRRHGQEMDVRVVARPGCNRPRLAIVADPVR